MSEYQQEDKGLDFQEKEELPLEKSIEKLVKDYEHPVEKREIFEEMVKACGLNYLELSDFYMQKIGEMERLTSNQWQDMVNYLKATKRGKDWARVLYYATTALLDYHYEDRNIAKQQDRNFILETIRETCLQLQNSTEYAKVQAKAKERISDEKTLKEKQGEILNSQDYSLIQDIRARIQGKTLNEKLEVFNQVVDALQLDDSHRLTTFYARNVHKMERLDIDRFRDSLKKLEHKVGSGDKAEILFEALCLYWDIFNDPENKDKDGKRNYVLDIIKQMAEQLRMEDEMSDESFLRKYYDL